VGKKKGAGGCESCTTRDESSAPPLSGSISQEVQRGACVCDGAFVVVVARSNGDGTPCPVLLRGCVIGKYGVMIKGSNKRKKERVCVCVCKHTERIREVDNLLCMYYQLLRRAGRKWWQ